MSKRDSLIRRLLDKARTRTTGTAAPVCWACSEGRCGYRFDNLCSCCRLHR